MRPRISVKGSMTRSFVKPTMVGCSPGASVKSDQHAVPEARCVPGVIQGDQFHGGAFGERDHKPGGVGLGGRRAEYQGEGAGRPPPAVPPQECPR